MSFQQMAIGKVGYCLVKGHAVQHKLLNTCWSELRSFLFTNSSYDDYKKACQNKER